jgi:asparagine synthetase B (glutamine-hydrolysing)
MCGIFGTSNLTPTTRAMMPFLAWAMEDRGKDSWGATDGREVVKKLGAITDSWELPEWERGIFHTRARSVGAATVENAHPFEFESEAVGRVIGIHNGSIGNHDELNRKLGRNFAVDSMHIFAHIAEGRGTEELEGWGACAWYQDGLLRLWRFHMDALHVARLETEELVFASTGAAIHKAARMVGAKVLHEYKLDEMMRYTVRMHNGLWTLFKGPEMKVKTPWRQRHTVDSWEDLYTRWDRRGVTFKRDKYCFKCKTVEVDRKKVLLCQRCLDEALRKLENYCGV